MKTKVLGIASDGSPAGLNCPNGNVFSLTGVGHISSVNGHYVSETHLAQERAMEMDLFNHLQKKHLPTITQKQAVMRYNEYLA